MANENCDNAAVMAGYTKEIFVEAGMSEFMALVKPDTDFDDRFKCFDTDNQEWLFVNGWNCLISDAEELA